MIPKIARVRHRSTIVGLVILALFNVAAGQQFFQPQPQNGRNRLFIGPSPRPDFGPSPRPDIGPNPRPEIEQSTRPSPRPRPRPRPGFSGPKPFPFTNSNSNQPPRRFNNFRQGLVTRRIPFLNRQNPRPVPNLQISGQSRVSVTKPSEPPAPEISTDEPITSSTTTTTEAPTTTTSVEVTETTTTASGSRPSFRRKNLVFPSRTRKPFLFRRPSTGTKAPSQERNNVVLRRERGCF